MLSNDELQCLFFFYRDASFTIVLLVALIFQAGIGRMTATYSACMHREQVVDLLKRIATKKNCAFSLSLLKVELSKSPSDRS